MAPQKCLDLRLVLLGQMTQQLERPFHRRWSMEGVSHGLGRKYLRRSWDFLPQLLQTLEHGQPYLLPLVCKPKKHIHPLIKPPRMEHHPEQEHHGLIPWSQGTNHVSKDGKSQCPPT